MRLLKQVLFLAIVNQNNSRLTKFVVLFHYFIVVCSFIFPLICFSLCLQVEDSQSARIVDSSKKIFRTKFEHLATVYDGIDAADDPRRMEQCPQRLGKRDSAQ